MPTIKLELTFDKTKDQVGFQLISADGFDLDPAGNIHMKEPLAPGEQAWVTFVLGKLAESHSILGVRLSGTSAEDAAAAPVSLDTANMFYGVTPFKVSHVSDAARVLELTLVDVHQPGWPFDGPWHFLVGLQDADQKPHWLDPRIYNRGDGSGEH
ncbi:MAG: hypothetical protein K0U98_27315 [Deltaproteobacteria bacterium]|nr:hypothetical protein [Deltaproteobacteria bacterium]